MGRAGLIIPQREWEEREFLYLHNFHTSFLCFFQAITTCKHFWKWGLGGKQEDSGDKPEIHQRYYYDSITSTVTPCVWCVGRGGSFHHNIKTFETLKHLKHSPENKGANKAFFQIHASICVPFRVYACECGNAEQPHLAMRWHHRANAHTGPEPRTSLSNVPNIKANVECGLSLRNMKEGLQLSLFHTVCACVSFPCYLHAGSITKHLGHQTSQIRFTKTATSKPNSPVCSHICLAKWSISFSFSLFWLQWHS